MLNRITLALSVLMILTLLVFLVICEVRRRKRTIRNPQPIHIIFKDPYALATEFTYRLTPQRGKRGYSGNWMFITDAGVEPPPEHRVAEMDDGKQGDTLTVTWKLRDGTTVAETTMIQASSVLPLTVALTKKCTVHFEQEGTSYTLPDGRVRTDPDAIKSRQFLLTFIFIGGLISIIGGIWLSYSAWFVARATKAPGQVIAMEEGYARRGKIYYPVFTFSDASGINHTGRSSRGSPHYPYRIGEKVTVLYDSSAPANAMIDSLSGIWGAPLGTTGLGLVFGGFSCFVLFVITRRTRS